MINSRGLFVINGNNNNFDVDRICESPSLLCSKQNYIIREKKVD